MPLVVPVTVPAGRRVAIHRPLGPARLVARGPVRIGPQRVRLDRSPVRRMLVAAPPAVVAALVAVPVVVRRLGPAVLAPQAVPALVVFCGPGAARAPRLFALVAAVPVGIPLVAAPAVVPVVVGRSRVAVGGAGTAVGRSRVAVGGAGTAVGRGGVAVGRGGAAVVPALPLLVAVRRGPFLARRRPGVVPGSAVVDGGGVVPGRAGPGRARVGPARLGRARAAVVPAAPGVAARGGDLQGVRPVAPARRGARRSGVGGGADRPRLGPADDGGPATVLGRQVRQVSQPDVAGVALPRELRLPLRGRLEDPGRFGRVPPAVVEVAAHRKASSPLAWRAPAPGSRRSLTAMSPRVGNCRAGRPARR
ncbi:hypothetical protein [Micromonospora rubida]|uniref:hypothetical protein n=1 Tax=Micromonospora rubida TaxID=2697657 RepID=UPI00191C0A89|nr:hypothetical protein [Micromonospora rubida]